eukprot:11004941-Alexandrium_andersonii.AAC.1
MSAQQPPFKQRKSVCQRYSGRSDEVLSRACATRPRFDSMVASTTVANRSDATLSRNERGQPPNGTPASKEPRIAL